MSSSYLDRFGRSRSLCHRLPARLKILLTLSVVVTGISVSAANWHVHGLLAVIVFVGHSIAKIPLAYVGRRLVFFLPMVFLLSISMPASQGFAAGWLIMADILLRSTLAFVTVLWLINVMPFNQLLLTLRELWVPEILVATLAFMYRYVFVLWDELDKMRTARRARTFGEGGVLFRWKTSGQLIGMLLIRAMERAERVYGAMCARGWDGHVRSLDES